MNNENQNIKFYSGENPIFIQVGDVYFEIDIENKQTHNTNFTDAENIRLAHNGLAFIFQEGRFSTNCRTEIENNE